MEHPRMIDDFPFNPPFIEDFPATFDFQMVSPNASPALNC